MADRGTAPVLELRDIRKTFAGVAALRDASLALRPGAVHALMGENGAGKSTLIKVLAGVHTPDAGHVLLDGHPITFANPAQARDAGVAVIYQEPTLFPDLSVAENIYMGRHPVDARTRRVRWPLLYKDVAGLLGQVGLKIDPRERVRGLSVADQQLVEVAKALSLNARVLIMDEPTAALTPSEVERLFAIVRSLRERGVAIVFIGHRLEEIFTIADTITVLRDGMYVGTWPSVDLDVDRVIALMVGRALNTLYEKESTSPGETLLRVEGLRRSGVFADVSFGCVSTESPMAAAAATPAHEKHAAAVVG